MTVYAICFDFPEETDPVFAGLTGDGAMGFAPTLKTARTFATETVAARVLKNSYGPGVSKWGAVVEVERVTA